MVQFFFDRVEIIVGKGENVGYQHFLLFPKCFQKLSLSGLLKPMIVWYRVKEYLEINTQDQIMLSLKSEFYLQFKNWNYYFQISIKHNMYFKSH